MLLERLTVAWMLSFPVAQAAACDRSEPETQKQIEQHAIRIAEAGVVKVRGQLISLGPKEGDASRRTRRCGEFVLLDAEIPVRHLNTTKPRKDLAVIEKLEKSRRIDICFSVDMNTCDFVPGLGELWRLEIREIPGNKFATWIFGSGREMDVAQILKLAEQAKASAGANTGTHDDSPRHPRESPGYAGNAQAGVRCRNQLAWGDE
jgi:hypothetical protein